MPQSNGQRARRRARFARRTGIAVPFCVPPRETAATPFSDGRLEDSTRHGAASREFGDESASGCARERVCWWTIAMETFLRGSAWRRLTLYRWLSGTVGRRAP